MIRNLSRKSTECQSGDRKETDLRFGAGHVLGAQQLVYFGQTTFAVDYLRKKSAHQLAKTTKSLTTIENHSDKQSNASFFILQKKS